jgi:glyoxylase-like metal-dependent hydrolase (beta-lactamase superfamily II)
VKFVSGDDIEIMPGIKAYTGSKHTFQNMYLLVNFNASRNRILLASDAIWFYMNFDKMLPASICMDPEAYTAAMKRMRTLVRKTGLIIPGHDEKVFSKFSEVKKWIVRINE